MEDIIKSAHDMSSIMSRDASKLTTVPSSSVNIDSANRTLQSSMSQAIGGINKTEGSLKDTIDD